MSMNLKLGENRWVRWLGVTSSIGILLTAVFMPSATADPGPFFLRALGAFVCVFTSLAKVFWPNLIIGLLLLLGFDMTQGGYAHVQTSVKFFSLAALALSSTPILNIIFSKKTSSPYQPSEPEHQGAPEAFKYELEKFRFAEGQLSNAQGDLCKIMIECALLHARNLLDFFTGGQPMTGKRDEKSIRAGHFVKVNKWWKSSKLPHLQKRKKDINKALSHLTYDRIGAKYDWDDLPKIRGEIESAYTEFHQLLPQEDRSKWPPPEL